jgi:hypothetical protein
MQIHDEHIVLTRCEAEELVRLLTVEITERHGIMFGWGLPPS